MNMKRHKKKEETMCNSNNTLPMSSPEEHSKTTIKASNKDVETPHSSFFESLPESVKFMTLTASMFVFFGTHNILQEAMIKMPNFKYGVMLGYMEVFGVTLLSYGERKYVAKETVQNAPLTAYPLLTICLLSSSALSNMSLNYINFPTKVVFRSCKLIPTMLVATIVNERKFSSLEYLCALSVCVGLVMFAAADWKLTPTFNPFGLLLVILSVIADSILPNAQEKLFSSGCTRLEVTFYSNLFTLVAMTFTTFMSGDFLGILRLAMSDTTLATYMCVYTFVAYVAVSSFMLIVKRYGAVTGVLTATARKGMTLILSFLIFPKAFSWYYVFGALLVLGGLLASSLLKMNKKSTKHDTQQKVMIEVSRDNEKDKLLSLTDVEKADARAPKTDEKNC